MGYLRSVFTSQFCTVFNLISIQRFSLEITGATTMFPYYYCYNQVIQIDKYVTNWSIFGIRFLTTKFIDLYLKRSQMKSVQLSVIIPNTIFLISWFLHSHVCSSPLETSISNKICVTTRNFHFLNQEKKHILYFRSHQLQKKILHVICMIKVAVKDTELGLLVHVTHWQTSWNGCGWVY